jgi:hypothetical protein
MAATSTYVATTFLTLHQWSWASYMIDERRISKASVQRNLRCELFGRCETPSKQCKHATGGPKRLQHNIQLTCRSAAAPTSLSGASPDPSPLLHNSSVKHGSVQQWVSHMNMHIGRCACLGLMPPLRGSPASKLRRPGTRVAKSDCKDCPRYHLYHPIDPGRLQNQLPLVLMH